MTIPQIIKSRGITEVVHFTHHQGLLGILHSGTVKARKELPGDIQLQYIYKPNAIYRKDKVWLGHVNLSISTINRSYFSSSCRWHRASDLWWCVLGFDPIILTHDGVVFTTTNNIYTGVK